MLEGFGVQVRLEVADTQVFELEELLGVLGFVGDTVL